MQTAAPKSTEPVPTADPSKPKPNVGIGFDVYNVTERKSKEKVVIKVFKNLKLRPDEHKTSIYNQIQKTLELQYELPKFANLVPVQSYTTVNNNVYIVSEFCSESLRDYLMRIRRSEELKRSMDIFLGKTMEQKREL
jgi:serine/threonine protein kinase